VKLGFALVTYNEPDQVLRLVKTLNEMFGSPPIGCHHDFGQSPLDETLFPRNVEFVRPCLATKWGNISVCLAALKTFRLLRDRHQPDWIILLSGCDYPVRPASEILGHLADTKFDAFLDHREIKSSTASIGQTDTAGFGRPDWIPLAYYRYRASRCWWPRPSKKLLIGGILPFRRVYFSIKYPSIDSIVQRLHHGRPSRVFGGDFWFQANRKAVNALLDNRYLGDLVQYYRKREVPEESLFHTVLCSNQDLEICKTNGRYADWNEKGSHPKWLEMSDIPKIRASGAFFARKFRPDGSVQEEVERLLLNLSTPSLNQK
jgi:hypothetical protein